MRYLPTGKWMGQADAHTIQDIGIASLVLMERAAMGCLDVIKDEHLDLSHTLIVCGSGNNGGDGFVLARLLQEENRKVTIVFVGNRASRSPECKIQMEILEKLGIQIFDEIPDEQYSMVVDAVFGVGLSRPVEGRYQEILRRMNAIKAVKMAVDIPSGVDSVDGKVLGYAFRADLTVAMQCEKIGTVLYPGRQYAGSVKVIPIGIDLSLFEKNIQVCYTYEAQDIRKKLPGRTPDSHKGSYGNTLVIAGSKGMSGAAFLCASAAYAVGAGLVRIYTPEENRTVLQQLLPEAIMTTYHGFCKEETEKLINWADTIVIGPGIGKSDVSAKILETVLEKAEIPCVIDADALNLLSENTKKDMILHMKGKAVLTPHMKEMQRLLNGVDIEEIKGQRFELLQNFTEKYPVVCVLKDSRTLVMEQGKRPYVNTSGNSAMAKGGSGDVLAGTIAGLISQKMQPYEAACLGVYLHGMAGDRLRDRKGTYGVMASELASELQYCERMGD